MLSVTGEMNRIDSARSMDIGGISDTENGGAEQGLRPVAELAEILRRLCRRGTRLLVEAPQRLARRVTIDLLVTGPRGTLGIVCDAMDAATIRSCPDSLLDSNLDRVYCVSALDSLVNPEGVARLLASIEPEYFRRSDARAAGRFTPVEMIRVDTPAAAGSYVTSEVAGPDSPARAA